MSMVNTCILFQHSYLFLKQSRGPINFIASRQRRASSMPVTHIPTPPPPSPTRKGGALSMTASACHKFGWTLLTVAERQRLHSLTKASFAPSPSEVILLSFQQAYCFFFITNFNGKQTKKSMNINY